MTPPYDGFATHPQPLPPPMVKQSAPISKAPANSNDAEDFTAADFMAGMVEYEFRKAARNLIELYGPAGEWLAVEYVKDEVKRKRK